MQKVGIIGSGDVGTTLSDGFLKHGYEVMRGSRDPSKLADWQKTAGAHARTGDFAATAAFGEIVVLAVKGGAAEEAVALCGAGLDGKVVLDATNPIGGPPNQGVVSFFTSPNESLMERLQKKAPKARFVKAFNSVGSALMVDPKLPSKPSMFICGEHADAKATARGVLDAFGWETEDMGVPSLRGPSSRCASFGASRAFCRTTGCMRSRCCVRNALRG